MSVAKRVRNLLDRLGWDVPTAEVISAPELSDLTERQIRNGLGNTRFVDSKRRSSRRCHHRKMYNRVKYSAKRRNIYFDIEPEDIVIPEFCPILGYKLEPSSKPGGDYNSPSVDRIDSRKGYTKDNIQVVSNRANHIKGNATLEEIEKLHRWMVRTLSSSDNS